MDLQPPKGGEAGLRAVAQHGGYRPSAEGRGRGGGLGQTRRGRRHCPHAGAGLPSSARALGVRRRPAPFPTRSDFPGGESQRRGERRGDPALGKPGRQEEEAPDPGLASGLGPPHGELPRGPRKAWLQPPEAPLRPHPLCADGHRGAVQAPADVPVPERNSFRCLVAKSGPTL